VWFLILALFLGLAIGKYGKIKKERLSTLDKLTTFSLVVLLLSMGISLGGDNNIFSQLETLGYQALGVAFASIFGSVLLVWLLQKFLFREFKDE